MIIVSSIENDKQIIEISEVFSGSVINIIPIIFSC